MRLWMIALIAVPIAAAQPELSASKDATFRRGNDAYFHGRYQEAVEAYEQVGALGVISADLFYNLGNAYLKAGQLGPSIYNYEKALELDPSQDDVRFNLGVARDAARKKGEDRLAGAESQPFWMRMAAQVTVRAKRLPRRSQFVQPRSNPCAPTPHEPAAPVRGENYFKADIEAGRVGPEQSAPRREFD